MNFKLEEAVEILERTPLTLKQLLTGLSPEWLECREGEGTWNAFEVVKHFIEAEKTNWIPRLEVIVNGDGDAAFPPFYRFAHLKGGPDGTIEDALTEFQSHRMRNVKLVQALEAPERHYERTGLHPEFGPVKLTELLSAWVVHDFTHLAQISRIMAKRYRTDVGPYQAYLSILKER